MCDVGESLEVGNFLNDDSGVLKCIKVLAKMLFLHKALRPNLFLYFWFLVQFYVTVCLD